VLPGFRGTIGHDALRLYRGFPNADHQLCVEPVPRELTWCDERFHEQIRQADPPRPIRRDQVSDPTWSAHSSTTSALWMSPVALPA
jgi:hypothetical protein